MHIECAWPEIIFMKDWWFSILWVSVSSAVHMYPSIGGTIEGLRLVSTSRYGCFGEFLTYECTIMGSSGEATVWTGTALRNCPNHEITLLHQRFTEFGGIIRSCNNGTTVAQSCSVQKWHFSTQYHCCTWLSGKNHHDIVSSWSHQTEISVNFSSKFQVFYVFLSQVEPLYCRHPWNSLKCPD